MSINYTDLHKVYNKHLCTPTAVTQPVEVEVEEEEVVIKPAPKPKIKERNHLEPPEGHLMTLNTTFDDPLRNAVSVAAPFAIGYAVASWLGMYSNKEYVGNQHISSMSDERVAEYRRQGLLPPPS